MNRTTQAALGLAMLGLVAGCAQPYHKQVREDANDRFEFVQAQMSFDQAETAYETGQLDKAMKLIDTAIARVPQQSDYHLLRGRIQLEMHLLEPAMHSFDEAIVHDPENDRAHYFRGIVLQRWSQFEASLEAYRTAYNLKDGNAQYLLATAEMLIATNEYDEARDIIIPRMDFFEHNAALHQMLGQISMLQHDYADASLRFREAMLLSPDDAMLREDLATAQFSAGHYEQAYQTIKQIQSEAGDEPRVDLMHMEARCLAMTGRTKEARNLYLRLSQDSPSNPEVWIELGNVAFEVGDYRRVALSASRAIALAPDRFEGYLLMGLYEQSEGSTEKAISYFNTASEKAPDVAWPHLLLGMLHERNGNAGRALDAYAAALRAEPNNTQAQRLFQIASEEGSYTP